MDNNIYDKLSLMYKQVYKENEENKKVVKSATLNIFCSQTNQT